MTYDLVLFAALPLDRAHTLGRLPEEERRRRAVEACRDKDAAALWALTEAYVVLHGQQGAGVSVNTLNAYRSAVDCFVNWATGQAVNLLRAKPADALHFVRTLEGQGLKPATLRVRLAGARTLYKALRWAEATEARPFDDVRGAKDHTAPWDKRQPYSDVEVSALVAQASRRDRALLLLCAHAGLRITEAQELLWSDVNLPGYTLYVRGKGKKGRSVAIGETLASALAAVERTGLQVIGGRHDSACARLQRLCQKAGVTYKGFHAFRHYSGTRLVREGASLEDVARHLGHAQIETTRIYIHWAADGLIKRVREW